MRPALGLIFFVRLDGRNDIQSEKLTRSVLQCDLQARFLPPLQNSNKKRETLLVYTPLLVYSTFINCTK